MAAPVSSFESEGYGRSCGQEGALALTSFFLCVPTNVSTRKDEMMERKWK